MKTIKQGNTITVDFRHKPTRQEIGIKPGKNFTAYEAHGGDYNTTLIFPNGTVHMPIFLFNAESDPPVGDGPEFQPKYFVIQRRIDTPAQAREAMLTDAQVLGLKVEDIDRLLPRLGTGAVVPQHGILHGLIDNWLSIEVELSDSDPDKILANYMVSIDTYHNDAIDKILHNAAFTVDLTKKPTRADLGFLDTYTDATLSAEWQKTLQATIVLPDGVIRRQTETFMSSSAIQVKDDPHGVDPPRNSTLTLAEGSGKGAAEAVLADAAVLGINADDVRAIFAAAPSPSSDPPIDKTLKGRSTDICDISVNITYKPGQPGNFAAHVTYHFDYK